MGGFQSIKQGVETKNKEEIEKLKEEIKEIKKKNKY